MIKGSHLVTLLVLTITSTSVVAQQLISISNTQPRLDVDGSIVDAHDGRIIQFENKFYWYGTSYGNTNGFTEANHYVCYSSDDMVRWKKEGRLLPDQPEGVYYRPHVIYNEPTAKYILWYNWYPKLWDGQFGVAVSDNPEGPFNIINDNVQMANSAIGLGDFGLFVDDDETAYISYNTIQGHQVSVEKLDKDYTSSTLENGGFIAKHMEAGSMFKRNGKYYLLTDNTCCFCNYGSGARVYISDDPLKDYTFTGNINRYPGRKTLSLQDMDSRATYETIKKAEGAFQSIEIRGNNISNANLDITLFTGNRPENCGDVSNPRVHPKFITPEFKVSAWVDGDWKTVNSTTHNIIRTALNEKVTLSIENVKSDLWKITPVSEADRLFISELDVSLAAEVYIIGPEINQYPIIPAQQTYIMELKTSNGSEFIWMGDLWGSASDNIKGHDYQYWSAPLQFDSLGYIKTLKWTDEWDVKLK